VLVRCGVRGHRPQQAPLDLVALCLAVLLGGGATTVVVVVGPAYHVCTAVLRSPQVGRRVVRASLAELESATAGRGHRDVLQNEGQSRSHPVHTQRRAALTQQAAAAVRMNLLWLHGHAMSTDHHGGLLKVSGHLVRTPCMPRRGCGSGKKGVKSALVSVCHVLRK